MEQWSGDSPIAARARTILTGRYAAARTPGDALAVIFLLHRALEDASNQHLGQPAAGVGDVAAKIEALRQVWPADLCDQWEGLHVRRKDLAHPRFINGLHAQDSADAFATFCTTNWAFLFNSSSTPPALARPRWFAATVRPHDPDLSRRLLSIFATEYAQAQTPGDMLAAALLFHKAIEQSMEDQGASRDDTFSRKVDAVFHDHSPNATLKALHQTRSRLVHPPLLDDGDMVRTADALADFVADQWPVLGDGRRLTLRRPPISDRYALPTRREEEAQREVQQGQRDQKPERRRMAWGLLLRVAAQAALALWLVGVARALWANWPLGAPWPAAVVALPALFAAYRSTQNAALLLERSGNGRGGLALLGLLLLAAVAWLAYPWPPHRLLSGRYAGQLAAAFVAGLMGADAAAPEITPLATVPPPARATATQAPSTRATATAPAAAPSDVAPAAAPAAAPGIAIGATVRVATPGNNLNGRAEPGLSAAVVASFANGATLTVVDGPRAVDGYTWWLVRGEAGEGWSAADFLTVE